MTDILVTAPADYAPVAAIGYGALGDPATFVDADNPLPVSASVPATSSTPLTGTATSTTVVGPLVPERGRAIMLTLSGTWTGTVTLLRSTDGGTTMLPLTLAGIAWGRFAKNCNEPVWVEADAAASLYLSAAITSGTLTYRVSQ